MNSIIIKKILEDCISLVLKRGAKGAECICTQGNIRTFRIVEDNLESSRMSSLVGLGIRILDAENRQGAARLSEITKNAAAELCEAAFNSALHNAPEEDVEFTNISPSDVSTDLGLYDPGIIKWAAADQVSLCKEMSSLAHLADRRVRNVRKATAASSCAVCWSLNSNGVSHYSQTTLGSLGLTLLAKDGESVEIGGAQSVARSVERICAQLPVEEAVSNAVRLLHGKPLSTGIYRIVLEPSVTVAFLAAISDLFSAVEVYKGLSLLKDKIGNRIGSECLTLIDDGRIYGGIGTSFCDDELVPTQRTVLVEDGILRSWLCNLQYGKRLGLESTGNGSCGVGSLPDVDISNFYIKPGVRSPEQIIAANDGCFCISELMGLHTIDSVSGNFSLAARGQLYKNGTFRPVSSVTIAGNLADFLDKIVEVGSDLRFFGRLGGCTMVVDEIAVSGS